LVAEEHQLSEEAFITAAASACRLPTLDGVEVEVNPLMSRRLTYPFVDHEGGAYVHSERSRGEYDRVGSIFDDRVAEAMLGACGPERLAARSRYPVGR
jgi:hypothetical protein